MKKLVLLCSIAILISSCAQKDYSLSAKDIVVTQNIAGFEGLETKRLDGKIILNPFTFTKSYYINSNNQQNNYFLQNPSSNLVKLSGDQVFILEGKVKYSDPTLSKSLKAADNTNISNSILIEKVYLRSPVTLIGRIGVGKYNFITYRAESGSVQIYFAKKPDNFNPKTVYQVTGTLNYDNVKDIFYLTGINNAVDPIIVPTTYFEAVLKISTLSISKDQAINKISYSWDNAKNSYTSSSITNQDTINQFIKYEYGLQIAKYQGECPSSNTDCKEISQYSDKPNNLMIHDPHFILNDSTLRNNATKTGKETSLLRVILDLKPGNIVNNKPQFYDFSYDIPYSERIPNGSHLEPCGTFFTPSLCLVHDYRYETRYNHYNFISGTPVDLISIQDVVDGK